jgi:hypothetical protein
MNWENVPGWFTKYDATAYTNMLERIPDGGSLIEVGCYVGKSLCSQAEVIKRKGIHVLAVDLFKGEGVYKDIFALVPPDEMFSNFEKNMKAFGLEPTAFRGDSLEAAKLDIMADAIFIDADHSYDGVRKDLIAWWPHLKYGGIIGGHDYYDEGGYGLCCAVNFFPGFVGRNIVTHDTSTVWEVTK